MRWSGSADNATESGTYLVSAPGANSGLPSGVYQYGLLVVFGNSFEGKPYTAQIYLANPGGEGGGCLYFRSRYGGAWNAWRKVTHSTV